MGDPVAVTMEMAELGCGETVEEQACSSEVSCTAPPIGRK